MYSHFLGCVVVDVDVDDDVFVSVSSVMMMEESENLSSMAFLYVSGSMESE